MSKIKQCPQCRTLLYKLDGDTVSIPSDRTTKVEITKSKVEILCGSCKSWLLVDEKGDSSFNNTRTSRETLNGYANRKR